ncbi:MAG: type secretion system protein [Parcubacteria group bacterium]|nr:type secretion system protein [Parcubacteria group bacterium]
MKSGSYFRGFTLLELLVVIAIIGILSGIILASLNTSRDKAKVAAAKEEMYQIARAAEAARAVSGKIYLKDITGSTWTCGSGSGCIASQLSTSLQNIVTIAGTYNNLNTISTDPWGNVYSLDENEGENSATNCTRDALTAVGHLTYRFEYGSAYCMANPVGTSGFQ